MKHIAINTSAGVERFEKMAAAFTQKHTATAKAAAQVLRKIDVTNAKGELKKP
jgi:hypothetical protein